MFSCHCCHVLCTVSTCLVTPGCCVQLPLLSRVVRFLHVSGYTWVLCSVATAVTCCALSPRVWSHLSAVFSCHCCLVLCALSTCPVTPGCCVHFPLILLESPKLAAAPYIGHSRNWILAFWVETPCRLVAGYRRLGGTCSRDLRNRASQSVHTWKMPAMTCVCFMAGGKSRIRRSAALLSRTCHIT